MATGHSFAVLASHSVRQPINPKTGLAVTTYEQKRRVEKTKESEENDGLRANVTAPVRALVESDSVIATQELEDGTNFYDKLLELKEAHQKTLLMWEKLYKEKSVDSEEPSSNVINRSRLASLENLLNSEDHADFHEPSSVQSSPMKDRVRDMSSVVSSSANPSAKRQPSDRDRSKLASFRRSTERLDNALYSYRSSMSDDFDEHGVDTDEQSKEDEGHIDTRQSAMARIEDMWDKFSVDNYCPRSSQKGKPGMARSNSMSKLSGKSTTQMPQKRPVTVPKPFWMSVREPNRTPKKSRASLELEQRRSEKKRMEDLECQKKFKAMPVPAHVHLRLYDELKEAQESRRREIVQKRQEILQSMQEPFQMSLRKDEKQKSRPSSASQTSSHQFRAHPFPSHIFGDTVTEKMLEEEEYRKIRKKMRAKELLQSSSLPLTMKHKGKDVDGRQRHQQYEERAKKAGLTNEHKFKPRINRTMPDFDEQYERFMQEMLQHKQMREATVCKPFNLRTSAQLFGRSHTLKESQSYGEMSEDDSLSDKQQILKAYRRRLSASSSLTGSLSSFDVIPSKNTRASAVRISANRTRVKEEINKEAEERRRQEESRNRGHHLKKTIAEKSPNMDNTWLQQEIKKKLQEKKKAERERVQSYQQDLDEMKQRVKQRPLLFEQSAQRHARQTADRKYMETLKKSGIDFDRLRQSSFAGSGAADDEQKARSADTSPDRSSFGDRSPDRESTGHESVSQRSRQVTSGSPSALDYTQEYDDDDNSVIEELDTDLP